MPSLRPARRKRIFNRRVSTPPTRWTIKVQRTIGRKEDTNEQTNSIDARPKSNVELDRWWSGRRVNPFADPVLLRQSGAGVFDGQEALQS